MKIKNKNFPQLLQIQKNIDRLDSEQLTNMRVQVNKPFSIQELKQMSKDELSSGKAVGFDRIRNEVLKILLNNELFSNMILELFNKILDKGTYPKLWKADLIKPVHKKGSTFLESNYRGISLSSCLAKLFNNLILTRLSNQFEDMDIFHPHLLGFRPKMRTSNNIFILKTLIEKQFMSNSKLYCSFVDFSKAFDTVWRKGLIVKIESYGVQGKMLDVIKSLYNDTTAQIKVSDQLSAPFEISLGVKQGDPPSPFFFNIYMNDLCTNIMENEKDTDSPNIKDIKVPCLFWADDLILISKSEEGLQEHLNILADYCEARMEVESKY